MVREAPLGRASTSRCNNWFKDGTATSRILYRAGGRELGGQNCSC